MSKMVKEVENKLNEAIALAVEKATQSGDLPEAEMPKFIIEKPADKKNGDFSSNIAMAGARAYHQACLLYTSPSPRDRTRSRMPSSA